jgi:hypothetical protein
MFRTEFVLTPKIRHDEKEAFSYEYHYGTKEGIVSKSQLASDVSVRAARKKKGANR